MRVNVISSADAFRLVANFRLQPREPGPPMAAVSFPLPSLHLRDAREQELVGIELGGRLGNPLALLLQQLSQQSCLGLAALGELNLDLRKALAGQPFERRQKI